MASRESNKQRRSGQVSPGANPGLSPVIPSNTAPTGDLTSTLRQFLDELRSMELDPRGQMRVNQTINYFTLALAIHGVEMRG